MRIKKQPVNLDKGQQTSLSWNSLESTNSSECDFGVSCQTTNSLVDSILSRINSDNNSTFSGSNDAGRSTISKSCTRANGVSNSTKNSLIYKRVAFLNDQTAKEFYTYKDTVESCLEIQSSRSNDIVCELVSIDVNCTSCDKNRHEFNTILNHIHNGRTSNVRLYTNGIENCDMFYCEIYDKSLDDVSDTEICAYFAYVDCISRRLLKHLNKNVFYCRIKSDLHSNLNRNKFTICVYLTKAAFPQIIYPSEISKGKIINSAIKEVMKDVYHVPKDSQRRDCKELNATLKHNTEQFYTDLKSFNQSSTECTAVIKHESLIPNLRPYQSEAVRWMLGRESTSQTSQADTSIHPAYTEVKMADGFVCYYNSFLGFFVRSKPVARSTFPGGILADEMGLGKTVEFLACMLLHPRSNIPTFTPQHTIDQLEWETQKKLKPYTDHQTNDNSSTSSTVSDPQTSPQSIKTTTDSDHGSDSTIEYSDINDGRKRRYNGDLIHTQPLIQCHCGVNNTKFCLGKNHKEKITVSCTKCGVCNHAACVNFDLSNADRGDYICPKCIINGDPIPSAATLIISPAPISHQWCEEIAKHISEETLKVYVYSGIKRQGFVHPQILARYDVVIMTYDTLRQELDFVDIWSKNSMRLRHAKRFVVLPSPIVAIEWWRVCLDEAQMVESAATKTAEMAHRLHAVNLWCVTGTPIHKTLNDLYGLMAVLGVDPYMVYKWWKLLLYDPYLHGNKQPMYEALSKVMWRTSKCDVLDQINIPAQTEITHWLTFSPVEEHFYRRTFNDCLNESMAALSKWTDSSVKLKDLDRHTVTKLLQPLTRLRQACCHPQAVRGAFLSINKSTMTMQQVLQSLIKKVQLECEDCHRQLVAAYNGLAALAIIEHNYSEAVDMYRSVLRSVDEHRDKLRTDKLQQLHTIHNLREVLTQKHEGIAPTLRDDDLPRLAKDIEKKYLENAEKFVANAQMSLVETQQELTDVNAQFSDSAIWWSSVIDYIASLSEDLVTRLLEKIQSELLTTAYNKSGARSLANRFRDEHGLRYILYQQLDLLESGHNKLSTAVAKINQTPSQDMVNTAVDCCIRPSGHDQSVTLCEFCKVEELFNEYEEKLFKVTDNVSCPICHSRCSTKCAVVASQGTCSAHCHQNCQNIQEIESYDAIRKRRLLSTNKPHRTWADSDLQTVLKVILSTAKSYMNIKDLYEAGCTHMKVLEGLKKEFKALRLVWIAVYEQATVFDELSMATTRLRLRHRDEPEPDPSILHILEPSQIGDHRIKLISDKLLGQADLSKKLGQLSYLQNLQKTESNADQTTNPEPCPICNGELGIEWSVLKCGHCFCHECLQLLMTKRASIRCAICRENTHASNVSYVSLRVNRSLVGFFGDADVCVKGSHSTKVDGVVRCLYQIQSTQPTAKVLIFSTWVDILEVIAKGLRENNIPYKTLDKRKDFQKNLSSFKHDEGITALLLPVQSGANGLNLIEATHVLLVEPILHISQQLQAIGRVHRIGQTKPTTVHHFLIRGTIEQRIHTLLRSSESSSSARSTDLDMTIGNLTALLTQNGDIASGNLDDSTEIFDNSMTNSDNWTENMDSLTDNGDLTDNTDNFTENRDHLMENIDNLTENLDNFIENSNNFTNMTNRENLTEDGDLT